MKYSSQELNNSGVTLVRNLQSVSQVYVSPPQKKKKNKTRFNQTLATQLQIVLLAALKNKNKVFN